MANTDNPKKDNTVNFITDIIPAFGQKVEESAANSTKIKQRTTRSFSKSQDRGRAVMFTYTNPKGYVDNTLVIIISFLYQLSLMLILNTSRA